MLNVLTIDGGPAALVQMWVLEDLEKRMPGFLEQTDVFAGTSDGGVMSLFLAMRMAQAKRGPDGRFAYPNEGLNALKECRAFVEEYAHAFLGDRNVLGFLSGRGPITSVEKFDRCLRDKFGNSTLGDLKDRKVAVVSFDTEARTPRVFRNFGVDGQQRDGTVKLLDVARATSSLPMITPVFGGPEGETRADGTPRSAGYLDGVLCANNPAMSAVSLAIEHLLAGEVNPLAALRLLSLGVSQTSEEAHIEVAGGFLPAVVMLFSRARNWRFFVRVLEDKGATLRFVLNASDRNTLYQSSAFRGIGSVAWGWIEGMVRRPTYLLDLLLHGQSGEIDRQCRRMLGKERYFRFEPRINIMREMTDLLLFGGKHAHATLAWTARRCTRFSEDKQALSGDEEINVEAYDHLVDWVKDHWFKPADVTAAVHTAPAEHTPPPGHPPTAAAGVAEPS